MIPQTQHVGLPNTSEDLEDRSPCDGPKDRIHMSKALANIEGFRLHMVELAFYSQGIGALTGECYQPERHQCISTLCTVKGARRVYIQNLDLIASLALHFLPCVLPA
jgi:hypothetical protein